MPEDGPLIGPAGRKPLDEHTLAIMSQDIIETSESIVAASSGASRESKLGIASNAPKLALLPQSSIDVIDVQKLTNPKHAHRPVRVINSDTLTVTYETLQNCPEAGGKVAVPNLAGGSRRRGGRPELGKCQEVALCYTSTLYTTFQPESYPLPEAGRDSCPAIFSPSVVVVRDSLDNQLAELPPSDRKVISVISATAPWSPKLSGSDKIPFHAHRFSDAIDRYWLRDKIRFILRLAASKGKTYLTIGSMGCTDWLSTVLGRE